MSKAEILEEISKLSKEERDEIRARLAETDRDDWNDADDPLSSEQKALLEQRLADHDAHPETSIPLEEAVVQLKARFGA
jgi:hypothetical protein